MFCTFNFISSLQVASRTFYAHAYILCSRSEFFRKTLTNSVDSAIVQTVEVDGIHPDIFSELLAYLYTNSCHLLKPGTKFMLQNTEGIAETQDRHFVGDLEDFNDLHKISAFQVHSTSTA